MSWLQKFLKLGFYQASPELIPLAKGERIVLKGDAYSNHFKDGNATRVRLMFTGKALASYGVTAENYQNYVLITSSSEDDLDYRNRALWILQKHETRVLWECEDEFQLVKAKGRDRFFIYLPIKYEKHFPALTHYNLSEEDPLRSRIVLEPYTQDGVLL